MQQRDVIIIGSGPAGASCAKALKSEGVDVLVLEKDVLPRNKTCSGVLFGEAQELLRRYFGAEAPDEVCCAEGKFIKAEDIHEWDAARGFLPYAFELERPGKSFARVYLNVWRNRFDKWLLDQSGAEFRERTRLLSFDAMAEQVQIRVEAPNGDGSLVEAEYRCKYLVGADGTPSRIRHALSARSPGHEAQATVSSFVSYCKIISLGSLKKDNWTIFFLPEIGDILCAAHQKDEYMAMHVGGFKGRRLRDSMEKFKKLLADRFGVRLGDCWREEGCQAEFAPPFLGEERVLLVGDAAGLVYLNGEGIGPAIDSGYRCGKAIAQSLRDGKSAKALYAEGTRDMLAHIEKCMANMHFVV